MSDARTPEDERIDSDAPEGEPRRIFERTVPDVLRRIVEKAVETGVEKLSDGPESLRRHLGDLKAPKDAAAFVFDQIDDTKKGLYRVVAKEMRDVLEHVNFADELEKVLTKLSFEINTTIRFVPNTATPDAGEPSADGEPKRRSAFPKPLVVSKVVMKAVDMVTGARADAAPAAGTTDASNGEKQD